MRFSLLALTLLLAPSAYAEDWVLADRNLATAALALTVTDWAQTRYLAQHLDRFHETNPLLGLNPSVGSVNAYFAGAVLGGTVLSYALPARERRWFLGGVVVLELAVTQRSASIGIRMAF